MHYALARKNCNTVLTSEGAAIACIEESSDDKIRVEGARSHINSIHRSGTYNAE